MSNAIEMSNIAMRFGTVSVLENIQLQVRAGEFVVLLGASGSGKSTLLRILAGLEKPSSGQVFFNAQNVTSVLPQDRDVAMVFQNYALYPHMTVAQNMSFALKLRGMSAEEQKRKVQHTAEMLNISELLERKPSELSGGQRQRVAIGRAVVREPQLFLFDEPLSNLDANLRTQMRLELKKLHSLLNVTTVYVTHDQVEAMSLADRICLLDGGCVAQFDSPQNIYNQPAHRCVAGFIGQPPMNFIKAQIRGRRKEKQLFVEGVPWTMKSEQLPEVNSLELGMRPNEIKLTNDPNLGPQVSLVSLEEFGAYRLAHLSIGQTPLIAELREPLPRGEFHLHLSQIPFHFFDTHTGKRLEVEVSPTVPFSISSPIKSALVADIQAAS